MAQPTSYEQYLLELVNRARLDPGAEAAREGIGLNDGLPTGTISNTPKQPLAFNPLLIDAARGHGNWMLATDTFSHTGSGGSSPGTRMTSAGYKFTGSWTWGENIAIRWGGSTAITAQTVSALHDGLFKSAGHRANILNGNFREAGFGVASGDYRGSAAVTATEDFARSGTLPFLTGVAFDDRDSDRFYDPGEGLGGISVQAKSGIGQVWQTTTWRSGGYQIQLPAGTYQVTFSGGSLSGAVAKTASLGSANVKLDLESDVPASVSAATPAPAATPASTPFAATQGTSQTLAGTLGADHLTGGASRLLSGIERFAGKTGNKMLDASSVSSAESDWIGGGSDVGLGGFLSVVDHGGDIIADLSAWKDRIDLSRLFSPDPGSQQELQEELRAGFAKLADTLEAVRPYFHADSTSNGWVPFAKLTDVTGSSLALAPASQDNAFA